MKMRRYLALFLVVCLAVPFLLPILAEAEEDGVCLEVNGEERLLSVTPYQNDLGVMAGAEELVEACGLTCAFDPENKTLTVTEEGAENVVLMHGATAYYRGEERVTIAEPYFYVENDLPMIEVGFFCELFGFSYHDQNGVLSLSSGSEENSSPAPVYAASASGGGILSGTLSLAPERIGESYDVTLVLQKAFIRQELYQPDLPEFGARHTLGTYRVEGGKTTDFTVDLSPYDSADHPAGSLFYEVPALGEWGYLNSFGATMATDQAIDYNDPAHYYNRHAEGIKDGTSRTANLKIGYPKGLSLSVSPVDGQMPDVGEVTFYATPIGEQKQIDGRLHYSWMPRIKLGTATLTPDAPATLFTADTAPLQPAGSEYFALSYEATDENGHLLKEGYVFQDGSIREFHYYWDQNAFFCWGINTRFDLALPVYSAHGVDPCGLCWDLADDGTLTVFAPDRDVSGEERTKWKDYYRRAKRIVVKEGVTSIPESAFSGFTDVTEISLPQSLVSMGEWAFGACDKITEIQLPPGLKSIPNHAFSSCDKLMYITFPAGLESIGAGAFSGCDFVRMDVPEGVAVIEDSAFTNCEFLQRVTLPASLKKMGNGVFAGCRSLPFFTVSSKSLYYTTVDSVLYTKDCTRLVQYPAGRKNPSYTIDSRTTDISPYAFAGNLFLKEVTVPGSVKQVNQHAFDNCAELDHVTLMEGVKFISSYAFDGMLLKSVSFPKSLETIWFDAFAIEGWCLSEYRYAGSEEEWIKNVAVLGGNDPVTHALKKVYNQEVVPPEELPFPEGAQVIYVTVGDNVFTVDGKEVINDVAVLLEEGRLMLPVRMIANALGADVFWDYYQRQASVSFKDTSIRIEPNSDIAFVNGEEVVMDTGAVIDNRRIYTEADFLSDALDFTVTWNKRTQTLTIRKKS